MGTVKAIVLPVGILLFILAAFVCARSLKWLKPSAEIET